MVVSKEEKHQPVFYDKLFALCGEVLPGCGCGIVVLPERYGYGDEERQPLTGPVAQRFAGLAQEHHLYLVAPLAEFVDGKLYTTQCVFSPEGRIVHHYRKVQLTAREKEDTTPGDALDVFDLPWFRVGIIICYDNSFPETTRCLAVQGAQVVFYPSYGNKKKPLQNAARCLDNCIYLIGSGIIDRDCDLPDDAFETGMVMNPQGETVAETGPRQGMVTAELPLDPETGKLPLPDDEHNDMRVRRAECFGALCRPQAGHSAWPPSSPPSESPPQERPRKGLDMGEVRR